MTNKNNRILIISGWYLPLIGGYIKVVHELALKLIEIGYNVDILTSNSDNIIHCEIVEGINVYKIPSINTLNNTYPIPRIDLCNSLFFFNLFKNKYRCIITNTRFVPICLAGSVFPLFFKTPLIHIEHGSCHTVIDNWIISIIGKIFDHTLGSILIKSAKINIGVSKAAVAFLIHLGAKNPILIHNSIDLARYTELKEKKIINHPLLIAYVGRLIYGKGIHDLISILPTLTGDTKLIIIGGGPYKIKLENLINQMGTSNVTFFGEVDPNKIPEILQNVDIFVNPSYSEGLPTSVLEACAAGCAVVATNVGGTNEIIQDGITGFLFQPGDRKELSEKLNLLMNNVDIRRMFGSNAQEYVRNYFSWEKSLNKWSSLIEKINE